MKILLVTEAWDEKNGPYPSLYPHYHRILTSMGHEVRVVDNHKNYIPFSGKTVWGYGGILSRLGWNYWNSLVVNRILLQYAKYFQPDVILLTKCENIFSKTIALLKQHTQAFIFNWNLDNPFFPSNTSMEHLKAMPYLDCYFSFVKHFSPVLSSLGCSRVEYLPCFFNNLMYNSEIELNTTDISKYACDIVFAASWSPEREEMLLPIANQNLTIWGNETWKRHDSPLRHCWHGNFVRNQEYVKAMKGAKIVLNVLNMQGKGGNNLRSFEATGTGCFLLTEYSQEQAEYLFNDGEEVVCFHSPEDLCDKVLYYLAHDQERERIAKAGQVRTLRDHTLEQRFKRILEVAEDIKKGLS